MIDVTRLHVRSFDLDHLDIFWEISPVAGPQAENQPHEIFDYDFYVLRSGDSVMGPYVELGGPLRDTYRFRDIQVSLLHKYRQYFYKIRVVHRPSGESRETESAASRDAEPDLIAAEIVRSEDVLFREFIGRRCWLYPIRSFGPRCSCYDVVMGRKTRSGHLPCFGTGWLGGFMFPIEVWPQFDPNPKSEQANPLQSTQQSDTTARMISFPPVKPDDILIESENRRWRVKAVSETERLRAVIRQELRVHEIPRGDIEFKLPLNVDVSTLKPAAERNFTNPQAEGIEEDYTDLVKFWKSRGTIR